MGSGFKDWTAGDVLTAADVDGYLMRQTVMTFADSSARDTALSGVLDEGMVAYLEDTNVTTYYDGSSWEDIRGLGGGSATSPGGFSSGDVLDADDINALPGGLLGFSTSVADSTATTSGVDITNVTFTVPAGRRIMLQGNVPAFNQASTTLTVSLVIADEAAATPPTTYYNRSLLVLSTGENIGTTVTAITDVFGAGTHTVYLNAFTNTGTAVADGNPGAFFRANTLAVYDVGES